ncbi:MAG: hypothetical protein NT048_03860 [Flavobacterium sp.]|nr:hypothetical protein [Flavobacterium sp.]
MKDTLNLENLKHKLTILQSSVDSLKHSNSLKQIEYELHDKQNIISQVNDFYDSAWLKLVIVISILGILIPIIAQYFQRKNLQSLTEFIRNQMNDTIEFKIEELKNYNQLEIEKTIIDLKENLKVLEQKNNNITSKIEATLFFLQGQSSFKDKKYVDCCRNFIKSTYHWLDTDRLDRFPIMFNNIRVVLKQFKSKKDLETLEEFLNVSLSMSLGQTIEYFKNHNYYETYQTELSKVMKEIERINILVEENDNDEENDEEEKPEEKNDG